MPYVTLLATETQPSLAIHYQTWGVCTGKAPLVFVHELGGASESFRAVAERVARDYQVIAYDQRGAGLSEKPIAPFSLADLADDVRRLADALAVPRPFHLMGLAMGALTALECATKFNDELASLVLCDGTHTINDAARDYLVKRAVGVREQGMRSVADQTCRASFKGLPDAESSPTFLAYRQQFLSNPPHCYAAHLEALANMEIPAGDLLSVRCSTLCLTGQYDSIWPPENGRELSSRLPNSRFDVVANAAHLPPLQNPEEIATRTLNFLAGRA